MISIKTTSELEMMRQAGRITATVMKRVKECIEPGVSTEELNDYAVECMQKNGARSAFLGYRGFPKAICVSINEEVVHGVPDKKRRIMKGDLVSLDIGIFYDGFCGDMAVTVLVSSSNPSTVKLVETTQRALEQGIKNARVGGRLSDISNAIERTVMQDGFSVVRDFVGHGIGRSMHEEPQIPNFGPPGRGPKLMHGMTLAIEPMVNMGRHEVDVDPQDGWTVLTKDRKASAHFEHTVAILENGCEILTDLKNS
jgi:methionyl aminopeptidase